MIRVAHVTKYRGRQAVLKDVSFEIPAGASLALIGPGGCGKTLLTKIIGGLVRPDQGEVWVDGQEITRLSEIELTRVRFKIGMLFQNYALFDFMDVGDNIAFPLRQEGKLDEEEIASQVEAILKEVDLPGIERLQVNELSGGMKRRVTFARAVIRRPPILVYDDPTAGLDPVTSSKIFILLDRLQRQGATTSITISHDLVGLRSICTKWAMLVAGEVVFFGTSEEIERSPTKVVRQFWMGESDEV
ncbi:MAG: ATP-binding cassette domain-containing protein [Bradymonadales bacterium]|nr:ATP-binding cassette domain-containing protein [Bradymonadales bacterium]